MITKELIQQNIPDIQEDHIQPLVELVNNTFNKELDTEVNKVRGSTFGLIDETLKEFGYTKQSGKTTDHLKNVLITLKENQLDDKTKSKLSELEQANKELQELSKNNNPDFSKKEKDLTDKINLLNDQLQEKDQSISKLQDEHKKDHLKFILTSKMPKVKEGIGEKTRELHVNQALNQMIELADLDDNKNPIFRNEQGEILYNPTNRNNPFTPEEMWGKNEYFKEIMDDGKDKKGAGFSKYNQEGKKSKITLTGVKNQTEADEVIEQMIISKGITKTDKRYQDEFDKIRSENEIEKLPMR